jgi:GNAT superfamily N-acetyltransferase
VSDPGVEIRVAAEADAEAALAAYEWLFEDPGAPPADWDAAASLERLRETLSNSGADLLLALEGEAIVGFCSVYMDLRSIRFGDRAYVEDLATDPERRSQGIGTALLEAAKAWAAQHRATHLELVSDVRRTDAHRFYEREEPDGRALAYLWQIDSEEPR